MSDLSYALITLAFIVIPNLLYANSRLSMRVEDRDAIIAEKQASIVFLRKRMDQITAECIEMEASLRAYRAAVDDSAVVLEAMYGEKK